MNSLVDLFLYEIARSHQEELFESARASRAHSRTKRLEFDMREKTPRAPAPAESSLETLESDSPEAASQHLGVYGIRPEGEWRPVAVG